MVVTITDKKTVLLASYGGKIYDRVFGMLAIDYEKIWSEPICNKSALADCFGACSLNVLAYLNWETETAFGGYAKDCKKECNKIYFTSVLLYVCTPFLDSFEKVRKLERESSSNIA